MQAAKEFIEKKKHKNLRQKYAGKHGQLVSIEENAS